MDSKLTIQYILTIIRHLSHCKNRLSSYSCKVEMKNKTKFFNKIQNIIKNIILGGKTQLRCKDHNLKIVGNFEMLGTLL